MQTIRSWCRVCQGMCGVEVDVEGGEVRDLRGDSASPQSAGYTCGLARASLRPRPERPTTPMRRVDGRLVPVSWDEALREIGKALRDARRAGPRSVGIYAGTALAHDQEGALAAASFALAMGTPKLYTTLALNGASKLKAAEMMLGVAVPLQADVGRAHYTVLLGADQVQGRWGPMQAGTIHTQALRYFRKRRKGTRLVAVDGRSPELAREADEQVRIRPGTEPFYMLGMAHATLFNGWGDAQFIRDYTSNLDRARAWLEPWTPARCAAICGIEPGQLLGVGLKFSRAAMGVMHASSTLSENRAGTVGSWAWLLTHALTANLLRPGGLYEARGKVDLSAIAASFHSAQAPEVQGYRNLLLQAPGTVLAHDEELKALVVLGGCPLSELPEGEALRRRLANLDLLVVADDAPGPTLDRAHWVLPSTSPWERSDLHLLDHALLPSKGIQATTPVLPAPGECRDHAEIVRGLLTAASPPLRGGEWGTHLRIAGRWLGGGGLHGAVDQILDFARAPKRAEILERGGLIDEGESDRGTWRVLTPDQRIDLAPAELEEALRHLQEPPRGDPYPLTLDTTLAWPGGWGRHRESGAQEPGIRVHSSLGFKDGQHVTVRTPHGQAEGVARLDEGLRPDAVVIPWGWGVSAQDLVGGALDPLSGAPQLAGLECSVQGG